VAVLCSRRAPGLLHLLDCERRRAVDWQIVCCVSSEETFEEEAEVAHQLVPVIHHPVRRFYDAYDRNAKLSDLRVRAAYDERTIDLLEAHEADVVLLAGYLLLLTRPMLSAFAPRILNVHHSDLLQRAPSGGPRYPGLRAVRDAILAGEFETRSTLHVVTDHLDDGPSLIRSQPFPVSEAAMWARAAGSPDVLRRAIWVHQEWMLRAAFGPLMEAGLDRLAAAEETVMAMANVRH
jgi:folate-dependent phosphoribosylglycinamide formyltransferase PurN